jgi:tetratricopeptide (TPR) repeat protein
MTSERDRLVERREVVARDLEELEVQVADGEIAEETAARLREEYEAELASLDASIARMPVTKRPARAPAPASAAASPAGPTGRSPRRVVVGSLIIVAALTAAIAFAARDTTADETQVASGPGALTVDPSTVSNEELEAVVAANPQITAMRMALADRYFEAEDYSPALGHYLFIADNSTNPAEVSQALARVGWMAYITNQPEPAAQYIELSLDANPDNSEAIVYRGFITLYGLGDAEAAIPQLEEARELTNISENVADQIDQALADARIGTTEP